MEARYYDPVIGRFLSNHPVGFAPSRPDYFNRYAYVGNDPLNKIDPTGKWFFFPWLIGASTAGGTAVGAGATIGVTELVVKAAVVGTVANAVDVQNANNGSTSPAGKPAPVEGAKWNNNSGRKGTDIWDKPGTMEGAVSDGEALNGGPLTDRGGGVSTGTDANGNEIVVRPGGGEYTGGKENGERANATLELKPPRVEGQKPPPPIDKVRYR